MAKLATAPPPRLKIFNRTERPALAPHLLPKVRRNFSAWCFLIGAVLCFSFFSWYPIVR